ncbi:hypothetical protein FXO38_22603 [Capsicum annuum]|nr:hypothetical protein FXO38_22603 [Capsicum annuum]
MPSSTYLLGSSSQMSADDTWEWWKNQNVAPEDAVQHVVKGKLSRTHEKMNAFVPCEFLRKCDEDIEDGKIPDCEMRVVESLDDDDNIPIAESLRRRKLMKKVITVPSNQSQSSPASNDGTARDRETLLESKPISKKVDASNRKSDGDGDRRPYVVKQMVPLESKNNNDKGGCKFNLPDSIELESDSPNAELSSTGPAITLQMTKASLEAPEVTATRTNITEGNINNHEKASRRFEIIDILKLEMKIRNLENINSGKVPRFRTS